MKNKDLNYDQLQSDSWLLVYKTRAIKGKSVLYNQFSIPSSKICNNNFDIPLKIEIWKYKSGGGHKLLGNCLFSLNDLVARKFSHKFWLKKKGEKNYSGAMLQIRGYRSEEYFDFTDFLRGGLNITNIVGVDFTGSNRDPEDPRSLHHIAPPKMNFY